jgi:hypothetical protein
VWCARAALEAERPPVVGGQEVRAGFTMETQQEQPRTEPAKVSLAKTPAMLFMSRSARWTKLPAHLPPPASLDSLSSVP